MGNAHGRRLQSENVSLRIECERLQAECDRLRAQLAARPDTSDDVWTPFEQLLVGTDGTLPVGVAHETDKMVMDVRHFEFGSTEEFLDGMSGLTAGGLTRSMHEECRDNESGRWLDEFEYVVSAAAAEDASHLASTRKFLGKLSSGGQVIVRDQGHAGMTLADFCAHDRAIAAALSAAEVAALRLYSGPLFEPLNAALRSRHVEPWATTIACAYSGVLKLSLQSAPSTVYRGVRETDLVLPPQFLIAEDGQFAGGVERAFMSTTRSPAVALDYSGGSRGMGSILVIDFDMASRGAPIQWLSQCATPPGCQRHAPIRALMLALLSPQVPS